jgi:hypothetical protein
MADLRRITRLLKKAKDLNLSAALPKTNRVRKTRTTTTRVREPTEPIDELTNVDVDSGLAVGDLETVTQSLAKEGPPFAPSLIDQERIVDASTDSYSTADSDNEYAMWDVDPDHLENFKVFDSKIKDLGNFMKKW